MLSKHPCTASPEPLGWRGSAIPTNSFPGDAGPVCLSRVHADSLSLASFSSNCLLLTWDSSAPRESSVVLNNWAMPLATVDREQGLPPTILLGTGCPQSEGLSVPNNKNAPKTLCTNSVVPNSVYIWKLSGFLLQMSALGSLLGNDVSISGVSVFLVLHLDVLRDFTWVLS